MSISAIESVEKPDEMAGKPAINISADAVHFDDDVVNEARVLLEPEFAVGTGRLYQFADLPPAKVIVDLVVAVLPVLQGAAGSALCDGLKVFLTRRKPKSTIFNFVIHEGQKSVRAHLETNDSNVLKLVIERLTDLQSRFEPRRVFDYEIDASLWRGID
jgi:hypothetical protein